MRVVHVCPTDTEGGADRGAFKLHKALQEAGADSMMLVQRKFGDDPSVLTGGAHDEIVFGGLRDRLDRLPLRLYRWQKRNWWTVGWLPFDVTPAIDRLKPDIVHLHWAGRGVAPIEMLKRLANYPIVWTLRDMWPLTGGCHYSGSCEKFLSGCGACPELDSKREADISRWQWRRKYHAWRNLSITFVALSQWMADCARRSPLTSGNDVVVIPNGIDTTRYAPVDKTVARAVWDLPPDKHVIAFGAVKSTSDPRKGFVYLREALRRLGAEWRDRAIAVVFGAPSGETDLGLDVRYVGYLHDDLTLSLLYASADVMVCPSIQENCGKTAIEAMACGTPVTAFANTGQVDIVDHKINGYLAENLSAADLARGIAWCLEEGVRDPGLFLRAREKVVRCFDRTKVAHSNLDLYRRLVAARRKAPEVGREDQATHARRRPVEPISMVAERAAAL